MPKPTLPPIGKKSKAKPKISERKATLSRRAKIVEIVVTTGSLSQTALANELNVTRQTIANDLNVLTQHGTEWLDNFTRHGWIMTWQSQIKIILNQINELENEMQKCKTKENDNESFAFPPCEFDSKKEPEKYFQWLTEYRKAQASFYHRPNTFAEFAALSRALSIAQQTLTDLVERDVLYRKVQSLQTFYENNKPKELSRDTAKKPKILKLTAN